MPQKLHTYFKMLLAVVVLFMSAGMLLPSDTIGVAGKAVVQKEQSSHFLHLLAEVGEEISEEDSDDFHKTFLSLEGESFFFHQPSLSTPLLSVTAHSVTPATYQKLARHLRIRVLRI